MSVFTTDLSLELVVHPLEQLAALLEVATGAVGLLEVDDEHLHLGLQARLLLLHLGQLGHQGLDVLLLLLDLEGELAPAVEVLLAIETFAEHRVVTRLR